MKIRLLPAALAAFWLSYGPASAGSVGFAKFLVPDGANPPIEAGIWYPTNAAETLIHLGLLTQDLAVNAPIAGKQLALVVISHGTGGSFTNHADTALALAQAGFVAAALTHTGDNLHDQSRALDMANRPRQLSVLIGAALAHWPAGTLAPTRVGAFGFSSGGFTVLAAAGGNPDFSRIAPHCAAHPAFFDCRLMAQHQPANQARAPNAFPTFPHDPRIRAIVAAAPALGFSFSADGLKNVTQPVQLWRAADDHTLPAPFYADAVAAALPHVPEFHVVAHADHMDFLAPCSAALAQVAPAICTSEPGFDRVAFHQNFNAHIVAFFQRTLAGR